MCGSGSGSETAAAPVNVGFMVFGGAGLKHQLHPRDVQAPGSHVCRHQYLELRLAEAGQRDLQAQAARHD